MRRERYMDVGRGPYRTLNGSIYVLGAWSASKQHHCRAVWLELYASSDLGFCSTAMLVAPLPGGKGFWAMVQAPTGEIVDWRYYRWQNPAKKWAEKTILGWIRSKRLVITQF